MNAYAQIDEALFLAAARARNEKLKSIKKGPAFLFMVPAPKEPSWRDISDWDGVKRLASQLGEQCSTPEGQTQLETWIRNESQPLIAEGCLALAAVAEIAAQYSLAGGDELLASLLESTKTDLKVAAIAAQRLRLFRLNGSIKKRLFTHMQRWFRRWEETDLVLVMRSVPTLGDEQAIILLSSKITEKSPLLLWSIALTLTDWATGQFGASLLEDKYKPFYHAVMMGALQSEFAGDATQVRDMRVAMIQSLGGLTLASTLDETASLLARTFTTSGAMEAAASVRAAKMLTQRFQSQAITALRSAFQEQPPANFDRFTALVNNFV